MSKTEKGPTSTGKQAHVFCMALLMVQTSSWSKLSCDLHLKLNRTKKSHIAHSRYLLCTSNLTFCQLRGIHQLLTAQGKSAYGKGQCPCIVGVHNNTLRTLRSTLPTATGGGKERALWGRQARCARHVVLWVTGHILASTHFKCWALNNGGRWGMKTAGREMSNGLGVSVWQWQWSRVFVRKVTPMSAVGAAGVIRVPWGTFWRLWWLRWQALVTRDIVAVATVTVFDIFWIVCTAFVSGAKGWAVPTHHQQGRAGALHVGSERTAAFFTQTLRFVLQCSLTHICLVVIAVLWKVWGVEVFLFPIASNSWDLTQRWSWSLTPFLAWTFW